MKWRKWSALKNLKTEKDLNDNYKRLGELMSENYPDYVSKLYPEISRNINKLKVEYEIDKREMADCKGRKICPKCGAEQARESTYCTECGMDISWAAKAFSNQQRDTICRNCGRTIKGDSMYCEACGAKR